MSHEGKVVIITGAGSGIGAASAKLFAQEGAHVIAVDINEETAENTATICQEFSDKVLAITADVSKDDDAQRIIEQTMENFGKLDVLINNAGIVRNGNLTQSNIMEVYDELMDTNVRSVILMTSLAVPHLVESKGCIVNASSVCSDAGSDAVPLFPVYSASKAAVDSFSKTSALELAPQGVRVNSINSGTVYTNIFENAGLTFNVDGSFTALGKLCEPEEVADLISYLASDKAKSITGACYVIDNGMSIK